MAANKQDAVEPNHRCNHAIAVTVLEDRYSTSQRGVCIPADPRKKTVKNMQPQNATAASKHARLRRGFMLFFFMKNTRCDE